MKQKKVFVFIGTTAELIKLIPVIRELKRRNILFTVIASRQNNIQFEDFTSVTGKLHVTYAVAPKNNNPSIFFFVLWGIRTFFSLLVGMRFGFHGLNKKNSYFIVHGDTVSSLMGALVAFVYGLRLVHIESGLRSFDFREPFPEEVCRYIISRLADIHFCPNLWCVNNLKLSNGIKINTYQNTLIEIYNLVSKLPKHGQFVHSIKGLQAKYFVLVVHRQEHVLFGRTKMLKILHCIFDKIPKNLSCVLLVHDQSRKFINELDTSIPSIKRKNIYKIRRLPYKDFINLMQGSEFVVTDGGSNQEELYYMGKPCLLLRNHTERIEGLGENVLLSENNINKITEFLEGYKKYERAPLRGISRPSSIIVNYLFNDEKK